MKECATRADQLAARDKWASDTTNMGWQNHYSPTYGRCYVELAISNERAATVNPALPRAIDELYDAWEERLVARCADAPPFSPSAVEECDIEEGDRGAVGCDVCNAFVKDRMGR